MCLLDILLQTAQSLLCSLKDVVVLANSKTEVILGNVLIRIGVELSRRDGSNSNLMDEEPAEFEVAGTVGHMRRELVVLWQLDGGHVGQNEVTTFGIRVLNCG